MCGNRTHDSWKECTINFIAKHTISTGNVSFSLVWRDLSLNQMSYKYKGHWEVWFEEPSQRRSSRLSQIKPSLRSGSRIHFIDEFFVVIVAGFSGYKTARNRHRGCGESEDVLCRLHEHDSSRPQGHQPSFEGQQAKNNHFMNFKGKYNKVFECKPRWNLQNYTWGRQFLLKKFRQ